MPKTDKDFYVGAENKPHSEISPCHNETVAILENELQKMRYRCAGIQNKLNQSEEARDQAGTQIESLLKEVGVLHRDLNAANARLERQSTRIVELSCQLESERSRLTLVRQALETVFGAVPRSVSGPATASCTSKLADLKLSANTTAALERAGVRNLKLLCNSSPSSLRRLGVSGKNIAEIEESLSEKELCLRTE